MFKLLVVLSVCVCVAYAATAIGSLPPKPEKFKGLEGCYIIELDTVIPFGSSVSSKRSCMQYRCGSIITFDTCGVHMAIPPCEAVEDKGKPYPDCCPQLKCP